MIGLAAPGGGLAAVGGRRGVGRRHGVARDGRPAVGGRSAEADGGLALTGRGRDPGGCSGVGGRRHRVRRAEAGPVPTPLVAVTVNV